MKNQTTTTFSSARSVAMAFLISAMALPACKKKAWEGKFVAPEQNNCYLLEYIRVYPDNTTDVKYEALKEVANFESRFRTEDSVLYVRELNKEWFFKLSHDTLFEVSNIDPYCFLVREK